MPIVFDFGAFGNGEAEAAEDGDDFFAHQRQRVACTHSQGSGGASEVETVGGVVGGSECIAQGVDAVSGGSFQDMTRIATMNEEMWSTLFLQNRDNLLEALNILINNKEVLKTSIASMAFIKGNHAQSKRNVLKE